MDKTVIALLAAMGATAPLAGAQAAVTPEDAQNALRVNSIADLLEPAPANAPAILAALGNMEPARSATAEEGAQVAQYYYHDHHHHHHHYYGYHHHHHHYYYHHHHHHYYYNGY